MLLSKATYNNYICQRSHTKYNTNMPYGHQEEKKLYYPFGIFYQCYALAHCTSEMFITELPSLVFTKQSYWRLVQWNVKGLWAGGSIERG